MRIKGLEPSLLSEPEPKSGASANSAISARSHSITIAHNYLMCQSKSRNPVFFSETGFASELYPQQFSQFLTRRLVFAQRLPSDFVHRAVCLQTFILLKAAAVRAPKMPSIGPGS
jgi:hypothetical protein